MTSYGILRHALVSWPGHVSAQGDFSYLPRCIGGCFHLCLRAPQGFKFHSLSFFAAVPNGPSW